jgi:glutamate dehydrogenase (NADP+)
VAISGSGNVTQVAAEKAMQMGAKVVTLSDSNGFIYDPQGLDAERLAFLKELKQAKRGRIQEYARQFGCDYVDGSNTAGFRKVAEAMLDQGLV